MNRPYAFIFSFIGIILLASIGLAISYRNTWLALLCAVASICFIGYGFAVKAKMRRKKEEADA